MSAAADGDRQAADDLLPMVYEQHGGSPPPGATVRGMRRRIAAPFVLTIAAAWLPAQMRREPHVVQVRDAAGKAVVDAAVTLFHPRDAYGSEHEDLVRGTTNATGRCTVALLPSRDYFAFAALDGDGEWLLTPVVAMRPHTTELEFAAPAETSPRRLQLTGLGPWRERGALRLELHVHGSATLLPPIELGDRDSIDLPPLPLSTGYGYLFVAGMLVHADHVFGATWAVPPPHDLVARIVDEHGKPVADAEVERLVVQQPSSPGPWPRSFAGTRHVVGRSAADGTVRLGMASEQDPFLGNHGHPGLAFVASKPGHRESWAGIGEVAYCDQQRTDPAAARVLEFRLATAEPVVTRVRQGAGAAPTALLLLADHTLPAGKSNDYGLIDVVRRPVDASGVHRRAPSALGHQPSVLALPGLVPPLAADDPFFRLALPRTLTLLPPTPNESEIDLRKLVALRLAIVDHDRGPAAGAEVVCCEVGDARAVPIGAAMRAIADRSGRVVLPILPGRWCVLVLVGAEWRQLELEVQGEPAVQNVQLEPLPTMAVQVVDAEGRPVAGAGFGSSGGSWSSGDDVVAGLLTDVAIHVNGMLAAAVRTDAEGRARLPLLPARGAHSDMTAWHAGRPSAEFRLEAGDEPTTITLERRD
jgi:hypothetical protein